MNPYAIIFFLGGYFLEMGLLYSQVGRQVFIKKIVSAAGKLVSSLPLWGKITAGAAVLFVFLGALFTIAGIPFPGTGIEGSLDDFWVFIPFGAAMLVFMLTILFDVRIMPRIGEISVVMIMIPFWRGLLERELAIWVIVIAGAAAAAAFIMIIPSKPVFPLLKAFLYLFYLIMTAVCSYWYFPVRYMTASSISPAGAVVMSTAFLYFGIHWAVLIRFVIVCGGLWRKQNRDMTRKLMAERFSDEQQPLYLLILSFIILAATIPLPFFLKERSSHMMTTAGIVIAMQLSLIRQWGRRRRKEGSITAPEK